MIRNFDYYNRVENPQLILHKINRTPLADLKNAYDINYMVNLGSPMTLSFVIPKIVDGIMTSFYEQIEIKNLIELVDIGIFIIDNVVVDSDGVKEIKKVSCSSYETILGKKNIVLVKNYFPFFNQADPYNENTIMGRVMRLIPDWTIGNIDIDIPGYFNDPDMENAEFETRYFDVSEQTLYNFLANDVANSYECIFEFDSYNKTISAVAHKNVGQNTGIFLSHDNLILTQGLETDSSEIVTALACIGGNNLDISRANPNGTKYLYDYSYYKNTKYISEALKDRLDAYDIANADFVTKTNLSGLNPNLYSYSEQTALWKTALLNLAYKQSDIRLKQTEIDAKEMTKANRISDKLDYSDVQAELNILNADMSTMRAEEEILVEAANDLFTLISENIWDKLDINNFFTPVELQELSEITYYSTYQNDAYKTSDYMSMYEEQQIAEQLYRQGLNVLSLKSHPLLKFSVSSVDFTALPQYQLFTQNLNIGDYITVEYDGEFYDLRLLTIEHSLTDQSKLNLTFANRYKRNDGIYNLQEILSSAINTNSTVNFNKVVFENWGSDGEYKNVVENFINNGLDASINNIKTSENNDVVIDGSGIRCRKIKPDGSYDDAQLWIVNNQLVFSDDGFDSAKLALGEIRLDNVEYAIIGYDNINKTVNVGSVSGLTIGDYVHIKRSTPYTILFNDVKISNIVGNTITLDTTETITDDWDYLILEGERTGYGLIADYLIGKMVISERMLVENSGGTFAVDENGVTIDGGSLLITNGGSSQTFNEALDSIQVGLNQVFYSATPPIVDMVYKDFWIDTDKVTPPDATCIYRYEDINGNNSGPLDWRTNSIIQKDPLGLLYLQDYSNKVSAEKSRTYIQITAPSSGMLNGDLWLDSDDNYRIYRYNGSSWVVTDGSLKLGQEYDSVKIDSNGLTVNGGASVGNASIRLNSTDGFSIYKSGVKNVGIDTSGNAFFTGKITASDLLLGGTSVLNSLKTKIIGNYLENINANTINTGTLNASNVSVINLSASNITSGTLTGRTVQTAASNKRVVLNGTDNSVDFYNSGGTKVAKLDWVNEYDTVEGGYVDKVLLVNANSSTRLGIKAYSNVALSSTNGYVYLAGSGVNAIQMLGNVVPTTNSSYNMGTSAKRWNYLYTTHISSSGTYNFTVSGKAVYIADGGNLGVVTSSERFKENIKPYEFNYNALINLPIVEFNYKKQYCESQDKQYGVIAETALSLGLNEFVGYDKNGLVDYFDYPKLAVSNLQMIQKQHQTIQQLEDRIKILESKIK